MINYELIEKETGCTVVAIKEVIKRYTVSEAVAEKDKACRKGNESLYDQWALRVLILKYAGMA